MLAVGLDEEVCLQCQELFEHGTEWDQIIWKSLARIASRVGHPCRRR